MNYNHLAGSTDFGNVSFIVPGIHPFFYICTDALNHTEEYTEAAGILARGFCELMFYNETESDCDKGNLAIISFMFTLCFIFLTLPGAEKAQLYTLRTAKALSMTAVDVVCCPDLLKKVRDDFRLAKLKQK